MFRRIPAFGGGLRITVLIAGTLALALAIAAGCERGGDGSGDDADDVTVELSVTPDPPEVGPAVVEVVLRDEDGDPINDADLEIEGNMSHAGMAPVIVDATGTQDGRYISEGFEFTMGGDWIITVSGTLPDGREIGREFDLKGVSS